MMILISRSWQLENEIKVTRQWLYNYVVINMQKTINNQDERLTSSMLGCKNHHIEL